MKEPNPRQRKVAKALIQNEMSDKPKSLGQVLEQAGYPKSTSTATPGRTIQQKGTQIAIAEEIKTMSEAMASQGITPVKIAKKINKLLDAQVKVEVIPKKGETVIITKEDSFAIDKGITHALKLGAGGGYQQVPVGSVVINFFGNPELLRLRDAFEDEIQSIISKQLEPPALETQPK